MYPLASNSPSTTISTNLITVDGLVIDKLTGEIHGYDDKPSVLSSSVDHQPSLRDCRSMDDFHHHLKFVDRRKLPDHTLHSLRDTVDHCRGEWSRTGVDCRVTLPQQRLLEALHQLVLYRNVIYTTQADLALALGTKESNLMKKLNVLTGANLLRVTTSRSGNIRTGEIKLAINPRLIFRGSDKARDRYVQDWYRPTDGLPSRPESAMQSGAFFNVAA
ncbi:hypothetical protein HX137_06680 [Pseudomonas sp. 165]|nr:hypothetical protein [Pseudomonas sp. 165]